ncbi:MAG: type II secretion system major pseudopilin GspG [Deltaproteobacteria bacterium]|nr:type II secretion system major pseudopilin GspG [Deltaproteobacteria bacterium]
MFLKRNKKGFTLIELLIVLVIIGLLASLVGPRLFGKIKKAKIKTAEAQINLLGSALDEYFLDVGQYPTTEMGLNALIERPEGLENWDGPYLKKKVIPKDPWGKDYQYKCPGEHGDYDLFSYGPDGQPSSDDITSWK